MHYELWLLDGVMIHECEDPAEMYVNFKDALRVYAKSDLQIVAGVGFDMHPVDHKWLRAQVLRTSVPTP